MTRGSEPSFNQQPRSTGETKEDEAQHTSRQGDGQSTASTDAASSPPEGADGEDDLARCPICQFIEAGPCKEPHQEWTACRKEAKAAGKDYVDECQDNFKAFLQCALDHRDYYEPFLEMLGGLTDEEEAREEAEQQQQAQGSGQGPEEGHGQK